MKAIMIKTITAALCLAGSSAAFGDSPPWAHIDSIAYAGSGCPAGSVAENLSDDLTAFTLLFDDYVAEIGPGVPRRENRKNCQINIDLKFPQGWSFTLFEMDYRGYVGIDRGVTALQSSRYYFQGNSHSCKFDTAFYGSKDDDFEIHDTVAASALVWSPCGANRSLNINTQVRLASRSRNATGIITMDSVDGKVTQLYGIKWKRCPGY
jgi:hypothetical protein